jgi:hypothetical protein
MLDTVLVRFDRENCYARIKNDSILLAALDALGSDYPGIAHFVDSEFRNLPSVSMTTNTALAKKPAILFCPSCFSALKFAFPYDRICACCSHVWTLTEEQARLESERLADGPSQPKVLQSEADGRLLLLEVKNPAYQCPMCKYPGIVPWQVLVRKSEGDASLDLGCPYCGTGDLRLQTPESLEGLRVLRT